MKNIRHLPGVSTLKLNTEACVGCGTCEQVCPHGVLSLKGKKANISDIDACMECGACMNNCPSNAIDLTPGVGCAAYIMLDWLGLENKEAVCC